MTLPQSLMNFVGYGRFGAPIWFLGMEEGFHPGQDEARRTAMLLPFFGQGQCRTTDVKAVADHIRGATGPKSAGPLR
jgi:hypothetical protein